MNKHFIRNLVVATALVSVASCAGNPNRLPSIEHSAPPPMPIQGTALPSVQFPSTQGAKRSSSGVKAPRKSEMQGTTWVAPYDEDSEYVITVGTANPDSFQPGQITIVSFDKPVMMHATPNNAFIIQQLGTSVMIAPLEGAPIGIKTRVVVQAGGKNHKLIAQTVSGMGLSELRFNYPGEAKADIGRLCSDTNYKVDKVVTGGPLTACTVVDATGANTATYFTLQGNTQEFPGVFIGNGTNVKLARVSKERLPNGNHLVRVQGSWPQIVLRYPSGQQVSMTRGS